MSLQSRLRRVRRGWLQSADEKMGGGSIGTPGSRVDGPYICPHCGHTEHNLGCLRWYQVICPECGAPMKPLHS